MGKLLEGKEFRNLIRLARYFPGTSPFGGVLSELTCHQLDALVAVVIREQEDTADDDKRARGIEVIRCDRDDVVTDLPESV